MTVHVVDAHGVQVPDADNTVHVSVSGAGTFQGADNGKEDDAEGYKSTTHDAFNGLMLAIVQAGTQPGPIHVSVTSPGLRGATMTLHSSRSPGPRAPGGLDTAVAQPRDPAAELRGADGGRQLHRRRLPGLRLGFRSQHDPARDHARR